MFEKNSFLCLIVLKATKRPFPTLKRVFTAQKAIAYIHTQCFENHQNVSFDFLNAKINIFSTFKHLNFAQKLLNYFADFWRENSN